jgi:His-Xaa-Ser system protein HxsD
MDQNKTLRIVMDTKIYPAEAIMEACHKFIARCYLKIKYLKDSDREIEVVMKPRGGEAADGLEESFLTEALECTMKAKVLKGTVKVRDQIFHIVFNPDRLDAIGGNLEQDLKLKNDPEALKLNSRLEKLLEEIESEDALDYEEDPLGIAVPWEEKHGMPKDMLHPIEQMKRQSENKMVNPDMVKDIVND